MVLLYKILQQLAVTPAQEVDEPGLVCFLSLWKISKFPIYVFFVLQNELNTDRAHLSSI